MKLGLHTQPINKAIHISERTDQILGLVEVLLSVSLGKVSKLICSRTLAACLLVWSPPHTGLIPRQGQSAHSAPFPTELYPSYCMLYASMVTGIVLHGYFRGCRDARKEFEVGTGNITSVQKLYLRRLPLRCFQFPFQKFLLANMHPHDNGGKSDSTVDHVRCLKKCREGTQRCVCYSARYAGILAQPIQGRFTNSGKWQRGQDSLEERLRAAGAHGLGGMKNKIQMYHLSELVKKCQASKRSAVKVSAKVVLLGVSRQASSSINQTLKKALAQYFGAYTIQWFRARLYTTRQGAPLTSHMFMYMIATPKEYRISSRVLALITTDS